MATGQKSCHQEAGRAENLNDCSLDEEKKPHLPFTPSEILDSITMIRTVEDSKKVVTHFLACHQIVAIDVKGRDLGTKVGKISLIAVGTCNGQCMLFDIHANPQMMYKGKLKLLFQCKELIKVIHDCCLIRAALLQCFDIKLRSIFDTQCAHAVIEGDRCGKHPRCVPPATLLHLSSVYGRGLLTPAAHALERLYLENCNFWDTRPLPCKLKDFAARGVLALLPEAYNNLNKKIQGPLRQTFRELCLGKCFEPVDIDVDISDANNSENNCAQPRKVRSSSADCRYGSRCRSRSTSSQSSAHSLAISPICAKCGSSESNCGKSPLRKKCKVPKFKIQPRQSKSAKSCSPRKKQCVRKKTSSKVRCNCVACTTSVATTSKSKRINCIAKTESCNCLTCTKFTSTPKICPRSKRKLKSASSTCLSSGSSGQRKLSKNKCATFRSINKSSFKSPAKRAKSPARCSKSQAKCPKSQAKCPKSQAKCPKSPLKCSKSPAKCAPGKQSKKCVSQKPRCSKPILKNAKCPKPVSKKSSSCLCKTLNQREPSVSTSNLVRSGWNSVMNFAVDSDEEAMDTDEEEDEENDFEMEIASTGKSTSSSKCKASKRFRKQNRKGTMCSLL